ncbi:MAG TPA: hypothetical protein ENI68_07180 [Gammaproteobacteria bacterium]|nr:hypothetical protein [Gammaproteobacteria bacterium]
MRRLLPNILLLSLMILCACVEADPVTAPSAAPPPASAAPGPVGNMPLLPAGSHLGMVVSFEPVPRSIRGKVNQELSTAYSKGMKITRVMADWADLEPRPGKYDLGDLREALEENSGKGLYTFVTISVLDSEGMVAPEFLMDEDDPGHLKDGKRFNDKEIVEQFSAMLEHIVPLMVSNRVFAVALSNEPQAYLESHPGNLADFVDFIRAGRDRIHAIEPRLAVTVVNVGRIMNTPLGDDPMVADLVAVSDVVTFNYGPFTNNPEEIAIDNPQRIPQDFRELAAAADGRQIILHELHCPSGYRSGKSPMNTSLTRQSECLRTSLDSMMQMPQFRAMYFASMLDWSPNLVSMFTDPLRAETSVPRLYVDQFAEWYATMGLVWYSDGTPKPAWNAFLEGLDKLYK